MFYNIKLMQYVLLHLLIPFSRPIAMSFGIIAVSDGGRCFPNFIIFPIDLMDLMLKMSQSQIINSQNGATRVQEVARLIAITDAHLGRNFSSSGENATDE